MLGVLRIAVTQVMQSIYDIGWSGAEGSQVKWEQQTIKWEDMGDLGE